jgi:hypothetical protein
MHCEPFERGLAAIALAERARDRLGGVPTTLIWLADHFTAPESLRPLAQEALLDIAPAAVPEMVDGLAHATLNHDATRRCLEAAVARHGAVAIPLLVDAMADLGPPGSDRLCETVAAIGEGAVDPLLEIARTGPLERSVRAALLLRRAGPRASKAIDALRTLATSGDPKIAKIAVASLCAWNPEGWRVERDLRNALTHADPGVRDAASEALARVFVERAAHFAPGARSPKLAALVRDAVRLGDGADAAYADAVASPLRSKSRFAEDVLLLRAVRWSLCGRSDSRAALGLGEEATRLAGGGARDRRLAALELGRRGRAALDAVPALGRAIADPDPGLRFCAGLALALFAIDLGRTATLGDSAAGGSRR